MGKSWDNIGVALHEEVRNAIKSLNFPTMTPIQSSTVPLLVNNKDVVAEAVTGSGKTLAFLIPVLEILKKREKEAKWKKHEIGALVVAPTRVLALQIKQVLDQLLQCISGITVALCIGGESIEQDLDNFRNRGGTVTICTPGRFEDLLQRKSEINLTACLKSLEILILDEADKLLDFGFKASLDTIFSYLPKQRRTGLFSATQTKQLRDLIRAGMRNPVLISVNRKSEVNTPETLSNHYVIANHDNKLSTLLTFIKSRNVQKAMLFLPTCACVDYWSRVFPQLFHRNIDLPIFSIHGKMKTKRKKVVDDFRGASRGLLLCTDLMARGMDIPEVDWVLQWDPPASACAFVHRVGRTARQGHEGSSLLVLLKSEEAYVNFIEKNQKVSLEKIDVNDEVNDVNFLKDALRKLQLKDRDLMDKATRAFVSHIRAYSKQECSLLLKVKELPLGKMAASYGLLKLPKMPELRDVTEDFDEVEVDVNSVAYKDKSREVERLRKLEVYRETGFWPGRSGGKVVKKPTEAWSMAKRKRVEKKERRMKRKKSKESGVVKGKKRSKGISEEDLKELAENIALLKKMKKENKCK